MEECKEPLMSLMLRHPESDALIGHEQSREVDADDATVRLAVLRFALDAPLNIAQFPPAAQCL
jgi:hypothetical protein